MEKKPSVHELYVKAQKEGLDFKQLLKDNNALVCSQCYGTKQVHIGGSFGGAVQTIPCDKCNNPSLSKD